MEYDEVMKFQKKIDEMMKETLRGEVDQIFKLLMIEYNINMYFEDFKKKVGKNKLREARKMVDNFFRENLKSVEEADSSEINKIKSER